MTLLTHNREAALQPFFLSTAAVCTTRVLDVRTRPNGVEFPSIQVVRRHQFLSMSVIPSAPVIVNLISQKSYVEQLPRATTHMPASRVHKADKYVLSAYFDNLTPARIFLMSLHIPHFDHPVETAIILSYGPLYRGEWSQIVLESWTMLHTAGWWATAGMPLRRFRWVLEAAL